MPSAKFVLATLLFVASAFGNQAPGRVIVTPPQLPAGNGGVKIKVSGYDFTPAMQVAWNGQLRATEFVNEFLLKAAVTQDDLAKPGLGEVTVVDTSAGLVVADPIPVAVYMKLAHNDLAYDPLRARIYVSVSQQDPNGPSLAIVDPAQGVVERYIPLPSEPGPLALSPDSRYLYVTMADRIRRSDLTGTAADVDTPASAFFNFGDSPPRSIQPVSVLPFPDNATSFITILGFGGNHAFVVDGTAARPQQSNLPGNCLVAIRNGGTLYTGPGLQATPITAAGLANVPTSYPGLAAGSSCPAYANGLIYGANGDVVDPSVTSIVRRLPAIGNVDVVSESNEAHFLDRATDNLGNATLRFKAFDASGTLLKNVPLGINMATANGGGVYGHLIHWGADGIAFGDYSTLNSSIAKWLYVMRP